MRALIEEHGGAVVTAAIVILLIGIVALVGTSDFIKEMLYDILNAFVDKAQSQAGF